MKKFVFVLMPFDESFDDVYKFGIKQTCNILNAYCERVDEQIFSERILDRIYNQISKADVLIADMTGRNANVFYEVGFAHGVGRHVILLTQDSNDIPFDFKHFPHIVYDGKIDKLSMQLKKKLEWFLNEENSDIIEDTNFNFNFYINGKEISENSIVDFYSYSSPNYNEYCRVKIDIYNNSAKMYNTKFLIGFEYSTESKIRFTNLEQIKTSDNNILYLSKDITNIYPNAYKSIEFGLSTPVENENEDIYLKCKMKIFTIFELKEINFTIKTKTQFFKALI